MESFRVLLVICLCAAAGVCSGQQQQAQAYRPRPPLAYILRYYGYSSHPIMQYLRQMNRRSNVVNPNADYSQNTPYKQQATYATQDQYNQDQYKQDQYKQVPNSQNSYGSQPQNQQATRASQDQYSQEQYSQDQYNQNSYGSQPQNQQANHPSQDQYSQEQYSQDQYNQNSYGSQPQNQYDANTYNEQDNSYGATDTYGASDNSYSNDAYVATDNAYAAPATSYEADSYKPVPTTVDDEEEEEEEYTGKRCYQCSYRDDRAAKYDAEKGGASYFKDLLEGGWDKCRGPFTYNQAQSYGIDDWKCESNCYIRKNANGQAYRGCYQGAYGVDPNRLGCHYQQDALWCFCKGDRCNYGRPRALDAVKTKSNDDTSVYKPTAYPEY